MIHDVEILPSEAIRNRTQMIRQLRELTREIGRMDNLESIRQIRAHRDVAIFRTHVQAFASTRENFRSIWV